MDWILQPGDGAHSFPGPSASPKSTSQQNKMPLVLSLGPQDTDQASSPVLGEQVCKAAVSLQQSARMAPNREKQTQKKLSGPAPFEYTRLQPQALRVLTLDTFSWVILQEATGTGQLTHSAVRPDKWYDFQRRLLPCVQNKAWPRNGPAPREPVAEGAHCAGGKSPGTGFWDGAL